MLIIDDNPADQLLTRLAVKKAFPHAEIHEAYDGREALQVLAELPVPPEVIFLDINMPGMDGFEFLEEYENTAEDRSVVVILSSSDSEKDRERASGFGSVKHMFMKTITEQDLQVLLK